MMGLIIICGKDFMFSEDMGVRGGGGGGDVITTCFQASLKVKVKLTTSSSL